MVYHPIPVLYNQPSCRRDENGVTHFHSAVSSFVDGNTRNVIKAESSLIPEEKMPILIDYVSDPIGGELKRVLISNV